jgi:hypothetical protein
MKLFKNKILLGALLVILIAIAVGFYFSPRPVTAPVRIALEGQYKYTPLREIYFRAGIPNIEAAFVLDDKQIAEPNRYLNCFIPSQISPWTAEIVTYEVAGPIPQGCVGKYSRKELADVFHSKLRIHVKNKEFYAIRFFTEMNSFENDEKLSQKPPYSIEVLFSKDGKVARLQNFWVNDKPPSYYLERYRTQYKNSFADKSPEEKKRLVETYKTLGYTEDSPSKRAFMKPCSWIEWALGSC